MGEWERPPPPLRPLASRRLTPFSRDYPTNADEYELLEECGRGVSATVRERERERGGGGGGGERMAPRRRCPSRQAGAARYVFLRQRGAPRAQTAPPPPSSRTNQVYRARLKADDEVVAVKLLDLESLNCSLDEVVREAATMRAHRHPNILPLHCSFVHGQVRERRGREGEGDVCVCLCVFALIDQ